MASVDLKTQFEAAAEAAKNLANRPDNDSMLILYGLYKQATVGDVNISQPWAVQVEARAKYDAWEKNKGMSQSEAQTAYVAYVEKLKA